MEDEPNPKADKRREFARELGADEVEAAFENQVNLVSTT